MPKAQFTQTIQICFALSLEHDFAGNVFPHDTQFTDTVQQHAGNIVIPHQQDIDREIPAVPEKLVLAACKAQATPFQNIQGFFRQTAGFLNGYS